MQKRLNLKLVPARSWLDPASVIPGRRCFFGILDPPAIAGVDLADARYGKTELPRHFAN